MRTNGNELVITRKGKEFMHPLKQTLFDILKHTRIQISPGEPLNIRNVLVSLNHLHILSDSELREILEDLQ